MSERSSIEWTEATWNPVTGCSKVSPGCAHCYAERLSLRFGHSKKPWTPENAAENVVLHPDRLEMPLRWRKPRRVFVNSMSDLFHELVPTEFIDRVFATMVRAPQHTFQILTKRPERMRDYMGELALTPHEMNLMEIGLPDWPPKNVWLGTSAENQRWYDARILPLLDTVAAVRFVSLEPLLGPIGLGTLIQPDWVIVGGESGPDARPFDPDWARTVRDQCVSYGIPFFFKQHGGRTSKSGGRELDGRTWDEMPVARNLYI